MHLDSIVSRKYATALFQAAVNAKAVDQVADDLNSLAGLMQVNPSFLKYLASPQEGAERKREFLKQTLESRTNPLTFRFLLLVLDKKRTTYLSGIAEEFQNQVRRHKGIVRAKVTTAMPLDQDQAGRLSLQLGRLTGKTVEIETQVDPAVLGGVIVAYDNQIIDRSVRRGLDDLKETLMKVRVL
jgi:F-type H+-transporting ATPase subunit delta